MVGLELTTLSFELPPELEAGEPPEARGLARDEVRLLVSYCRDHRLVHARFRELPAFLKRGDVLVINTSGTMKAALPAERAGGEPIELHLSTCLPAGLWVVELRLPLSEGSQPFFRRPGWRGADFTARGAGGAACSLCASCTLRGC